LKEHPEVYAQIEKKIKEKAGLIPAPAEKEKPKVEAGSPSPAALPAKPALAASSAPIPVKVEPKREAAFVPTDKAKLALKK